MLTYGCTRLEMGVQSVYEDVARDTNRGHTVEAVKECFCLAKDAGFKVGFSQVSGLLFMVQLAVVLALAHFLQQAPGCAKCGYPIPAGSSCKGIMTGSGAGLQALDFGSA